MPTSLDASALAAFSASFGDEPTTLARAPARVELLGNHTDYNGGLVLAAAIDRFTVVVGRAIPRPEGRARSAHWEAPEQFGLEPLERGEPGSWGRYVRGVAWA